MGGNQIVGGRLFGLSFGIILCCASGLKAEEEQVTRPSAHQVLTIEAGWNAIHLQVDPLDRRPAEVFAGLPIDVVARYFRLITAVEFISDPTEAPWKNEGWGVWYAPHREDAFLSNLHAITGNQTYLVHATEAFEWSLQGSVQLAQQRWRADSYNLVGFAVDAAAPPTFSSFFAGSDGKIGESIYRLIDGHWTKVLNPASATLRAGEAYWVSCRGKTDYQGPLAVTGSRRGTVEFGPLNTVISVEVHNRLPASQEVRFRMLSDPGSPSIPMSLLSRKAGTLDVDRTPLSGAVNTRTVAPGKGERLRLELSRDQLGGEARSGVLEFSAGGSVVRVPIQAHASPSPDQ